MGLGSSFAWRISSILLCHDLDLNNNLAFISSTAYPLNQGSTLGYGLYHEQCHNGFESWLGWHPYNMDAIFNPHKTISTWNIDIYHGLTWYGRDQVKNPNQTYWPGMILKQLDIDPWDNSEAWILKTLIWNSYELVQVECPFKCFMSNIIH